MWRDQASQHEIFKRYQGLPFRLLTRCQGSPFRFLTRCQGSPFRLLTRCQGSPFRFLTRCQGSPFRLLLPDISSDLCLGLNNSPLLGYFFQMYIVYWNSYAGSKCNADTSPDLCLGLNNSLPPPPLLAVHINNLLFLNPTLTVAHRYRPLRAQTRTVEASGIVDTDTPPFPKPKIVTQGDSLLLGRYLKNAVTYKNSNY